jgi:hypothetical protein
MVKIQISLKFAQKVITEMDKFGIQIFKFIPNIRNNTLEIECQKYPSRIKSLNNTDWEMA